MTRTDEIMARVISARKQFYVSLDLVDGGTWSGYAKDKEQFEVWKAAAERKGHIVTS